MAFYTFCYPQLTKRLLVTVMALCLSAITFAQTDSITLAVKPSYDSVSGLHRFLFGENYHKQWATPVTVKVLHLATEKGGLHVVKQGGGMQTRSLRLQDSAGKEWVLRSLEKYPERKLPANLKQSVVKDILTDQITTANPFAALTVPVFAAALDIPHANPQIVYVADDTALGNYREAYANKIYLFEERDGSGDIDADGTDKVLDKLKSDNDVAIDQTMVLRARLLDMLLGDWDRHEDQWRWQKDKHKKEVVYTPIPRDRDQVYYKTSGVFPWIVSHQFLMSKFQGFNYSIRDINGWNVNARYFDRKFLTALSEEQWQQQIAYVQSILTDSLIAYAIARLPAPIFEQTGKETIHKLIARRNTLQHTAIEYYRFISATVDIATSDKHELFNINYADSGKVEVTIFKMKKTGEQDKLLYSRVFVPAVTQEIRLYGRGGNDRFWVTGNYASPIKVRMIGGDGIDSFAVNSEVNNKRLYLYDRKDQPNRIATDIAARLRLGKDSSVNRYDSNSFQYNYSGPVFAAGYNADDHIILKTGWLRTTHGFRKEPYATKQELGISYSTGRQFFRITYDADFRKVFGNNDLLINVYSRGPNYMRNFFGIGNNTAFPNEGNRKIKFYRTRFDYTTAEVRIRHPFTPHLSLLYGLRGQYYTAGADDNTNNTLALFNQSQPEEAVFGYKFFAGPTAGIVYDSRNNDVMPTTGKHLVLNIYGQQQLNGSHNNFVQAVVDAAHFYALNKDSTIVLANRIGGGTTIGQPYFFQLLYLGGTTNLRGYRNYRFAGKSYAFHNVELRIKLFDFVSYLLPGTVGITLFNDVGRVWQPGESSARWHNGYGGGIYIQPAGITLIQVQAGHSTEGWLPYVRIGFRF